MDLDIIYIKNLRLRGILGINPDERVNRQDILINLALYVDVRAAAASDDIADAVNYKSITKRIIEHVENGQDFLVEKLVTDIANIVLREFNVARVRVRVEKPGALRFADSVGIEIERGRDEPA